MNQQYLMMLFQPSHKELFSTCMILTEMNLFMLKIGLNYADTHSYICILIQMEFVIFYLLLEKFSQESMVADTNRDFYEHIEQNVFPLKIHETFMWTNL